MRLRLSVQSDQYCPSVLYLLMHLRMLKQCIQLCIRVRTYIALVMRPHSHSMTKHVAEWPQALAHH